MALKDQVITILAQAKSDESAAAASRVDALFNPILDAVAALSDDTSGDIAQLQAQILDLQNQMAALVVEKDALTVQVNELSGKISQIRSILGV